MPVDDPELRANLEKRPSFALKNEEFLSREIEIELTRLFEK
jgi:hypothetical protein